MSKSSELLKLVFTFNLFFTLAAAAEEPNSTTLASQGELIKSLLYIFLFLSVLGVMAKSEKFANFFHKRNDTEPQTTIHGLSLV